MFAVSPTDNDWFEFLKGVELNSYVNFWTPTPWNVKKLNISDRWYFLLKSPIREIAGFGEFVEYKNMTAEQAWNEFGQRNGCIDKADFVKRIQQYIDKNSRKFGKIDINVETYKIGCIILKNCEFWDEEFFKNPKKYQIDFAKEVVKFKYFKNNDPFQELEIIANDEFFPLDKTRDENKRLVNQRSGQGKFKGAILKAYENRCCISGETCPELLEAAHIQRYLDEQSNHIQNGILLRVDLHRLFDSGLLSITEDYEVVLSELVDSITYTMFNKAKIRLPQKGKEWPSKKALKARESNFRK